MNDESAPAGEYEPNESYVKSLFARPVRRPKPKAEVWVAGEAFGGIDPAEAARRRYENRHRRPMKIKEENR